MYYVGFSTATISASLILFQGFNTTSASTILSLLDGFIVTFLGVHLLNISRTDADDAVSVLSNRHSLENGIADTRLSSRLSNEGWPSTPHAIGLNGAPGHMRRSSRGSVQRNSLGNVTLFDGDMALGELREEDEDASDEESNERTRLNPSKKKVQHRGLEIDAGRTSGSRNHSRSPDGGRLPL